MNNELPNWLASEESVKSLFSLLGFQVDNIISISGRQIDLVATRSTTFSLETETWVVEITTELVGERKGSSDYQKLDLARKEYNNSKAMLVSTKGFTGDQKATLNKLGVLAVTFDELERDTLNIGQYARASLAAIADDSKPDIGYHPDKYIEPEIEFVDQNGKTKRNGVSFWINEFMTSSDSVAYTILGSLGTGKTSLLKHIHRAFCLMYLDNPSVRPITILISLGKFKQHSGNIEQMLLSVLRGYGLERFPAGYISFLIKQKRIILLLDGLDEIHPIQNTDDVLSTLITLFDQISKDGLTVISSRKELFSSSHEEIAYFGTFTAPKLADLQQKLTRELRGHPKTRTLSLLPFDMPRIFSYFERRCGLTKENVEDLFEKFYGFRDMAKTPVLLSMMATAVEQDLIDPKEEYLFPILTLYDKYTDRWIERDRDRAKLTAEQRRALSESLATHMMWSGIESETWSYVVDVLRKHPQWRAAPLSEEEAGLDIRRSGFLSRDLDDKFRFSHRSIQEFFSARTEYQRLRSGERPRHVPSNGFRLFLSNMLAETWVKEGLPISIDPSNSGVSDVAKTQISLLAAASSTVPDGCIVHFSCPHSIVTNEFLKWSRVRFDECRISHSGSLDFLECHFQSTRMKFSIEDDDRVLFKNCLFEKVSINFDKIPSWKVGFQALGAAQAALDLPGFVWDLCSLKSSGVKIMINDIEWVLSLENINICAEFFLRARRKTLVKSLESSTSKKGVSHMVRPLVVAGWVEYVDTFRQEEIIEITPKYRTMVGRLGSSPLEVQEEFLIFDSSSG